MKYNDNGVIKEIPVKASDTLPIGSVVEFDGDIIPSGWEEVTNKVVLYDDTTGIKTDVTLSDSAENYDYLEIFARSNDKIYVSQKVYKPNSKEVLLIASYPYSSGVTYMKMTSYSINGNVISPKNYCELALGPTISNGNSNNLYIVRVIGYKEV